MRLLKIMRDQGKKDKNIDLPNQWVDNEIIKINGPIQKQKVSKRSYKPHINLY